MDVQKKTILIVDDESALLGLYSKLFGKHYAIETAQNADAALAYLREKRPDLLLTDYQMPPGKNGLLLVKEAKVLHPDLTCIIASGTWGDEQSIDDALAAGAVETIQKPFSLSAVRTVIAKYVAPVIDSPPQQ